MSDLKKLTQEVFNRPDCPYWAISAAVNKYGVGKWYSVNKGVLIDNQDTGLWEHDHVSGSWSKTIGKRFNTTNWQNSAINRE